MKRLLLLLLCLDSQAANYTFFTPAQTTNVINGLITSGTFAAGAYNVNQFAVTPYSSVALKNGFTGTNGVLSTPTITGGGIFNSQVSGLTTPGLTGILYANNASAMTVLLSTVGTNSLIRWNSAGTGYTNSVISEDGTNVDVTLPLRLTKYLAVGSGNPIYKIVVTNYSFNFASIAAGDTETITCPATGASPDGTVNWMMVAPSTVLIYSAWVSSTNTISFRAYNASAAPIDAGIEIAQFTVFNHN